MAAINAKHVNPLLTRNAIKHADQEILRIFRRLAIKDAIKMVAEAEEGTVLSSNEKRLKEVLVSLLEICTGREYHVDERFHRQQCTPSIYCITHSRP